MKRVIRIGAAAAALALAPGARPCDVRGYDPTSFSPLDDACSMTIRFEVPEATDYDAQTSYAALDDRGEGSGSGEPGAVDATDDSREAEFVHSVWTSP